MCAPGVLLECNDQSPATAAGGMKIMQVSNTGLGKQSFCKDFRADVLTPSPSKWAAERDPALISNAL